MKAMASPKRSLKVYYIPQINVHVRQLKDFLSD